MTYESQIYGFGKFLRTIPVLPSADVLVCFMLCWNLSGPLFLRLLIVYVPGIAFYMSMIISFIALGTDVFVVTLSKAYMSVPIYSLHSGRLMRLLR